MVSHFGEVIFPSSRAFWDDEDEYENVEHAKLCVCWLERRPERIQNLIIMEGNPLISFMEQSCDKAEKVCVIKNERETEVSVIYRIEKQIYLCLILPQFLTKDAAEFISQVSDVLLRAESIISIICHHISQFQGTNVPEIASFLRILTTKNTNITDCDVKSLEQPNIVFGVGAGVLSYAEFMDISAKLYILYVDSFVLDSTCAAPLLKVLPIKIQLQDPKSTKTFFNKENLYM